MHTLHTLSTRVVFPLGSAAVVAAFLVVLPARATATGTVTGRPGLVDARCREVAHPERARHIYVSGDIKAPLTAGGRPAGGRSAPLQAKDLSVHRLGNSRPERAPFVRAGSCRGRARYRWTGRVVPGTAYRVLYKKHQLVGVVGVQLSTLALETGVAFVRGARAELFFPTTARPLQVGRRVTIIVPGARAVLQASVDRAAASAKPHPFPPFGAQTRRYSARLNSSKPLMPAVGLVSLAARAARLGSTGSGDLDGDGVPEHFRSCTSSEGLHLTIWAGPKPLAGKRRWHAYYYLGYDTQPTCKPADYAP